MPNPVPSHNHGIEDLPIGDGINQIPLSQDIPGLVADSAPFVATNEYYVDVTAAANPNRRIYPTIVLALVAGNTELGSGALVNCRLRDGQTHAWNGSYGIPTPDNLVAIYGTEGVDTGLDLTGATISTDLSVQFQDLTLTSAQGSTSIGAPPVTFVRVDGTISFDVIDTPSFLPVGIDLIDCNEPQFGVRPTTNSSGGSISIRAGSNVAHVPSFPGLPFLDNAAGLANWAVDIQNASCRRTIGTPAGFECFVGNPTGGDSVIFTNATLSGIASFADFTVCGNPVVQAWKDSRVSIENSGPGTDFLFETLGAGGTQTQEGLTIENVPNPNAAKWPTVAPAGTIGLHSTDAGGILRFQGGGDTPQWRGPNNSVRMEVGTNGIIPAASLASSYDATGFISPDQGPVNTMFTVSGHVIAEGVALGVPVAAEWLVDEVYHRDGAGAYTLINSATTLVFTTLDASETLAFGLNVNLGISVDVNQGTNLGLHAWRAQLEVVQVHAF